MATTRKSCATVSKRLDRLRDVSGEDSRAIESFRIRELGPILDHRHVEIEELRLTRNGARDVAAAGDDEARPAGDRFDQELVLVIGNEQAGGPFVEL